MVRMSKITKSQLYILEFLAFCHVIISNFLFQGIFVPKNGKKNKINQPIQTYLPWR